MRKAQDGGVPADPMLPVLARTMLASGEARPVAHGLDDEALSTPAAKADLATTRAEAHACLGDAAVARDGEALADAHPGQWIDVGEGLAELRAELR